MLAGIIFHLLIHCIYWQHQQHLMISCMWSCQVTLSFTYDCQIISIQGVWNCHVQLAYKTSLAVSIYWPWLACSWTGKTKVGIKNQSINGCITFSKFVVLLFRCFFHYCYNFNQNKFRSCLYYGDLECMFLYTN